MKLSTKCRYGLRAVVEIANRYRQGSVKRKEIVKNQDISDSYLENILIILKSNHIIETNRGINGGYVLARAPSAITVLDIVTAIEGKFSLVECLNQPDRCDMVQKCVTRTVWQELVDAWNNVLGKTTVQDLLDRKLEHTQLDYSI